MRRRLLNALTLLSLLLALALAGLWARSRWWRGDWHAYDKPQVSWAISFSSVDGTVSLGWTTQRPSPPALSSPHPFAPGFHHYDPLWGFVAPEDRVQGITRWWPPADWHVDSTGGSLVVADWVPLVFFVVLPTWWVVGGPPHTRRRRRRLSLCTQCGYDLRGTPTAATCPECGELIPATKPAEAKA